MGIGAFTNYHITVGAESNTLLASTYPYYITDAYDDCKELVPYVGWLGSETAGKIRIAGVTVRKVGDQWNDAASCLGFTPSSNEMTPLTEVDSTDSPIAYQKTVYAAFRNDRYSYSVNAPLASFPQPNATDTWTLSFWAKVNSSGSALFKRTGESSSPTQTWLTADSEWHYYTMPLVMTNSVTLATMMLGFTLYPQTELYLNGMSLVPGSVALANDSHQNSAALKNITIDTGTTKFNTAIEYDTDANRHAYSRVKHYINNGKAYSYEYDTAGNISKITNPDGSWVTYTYDALNQLTQEQYSLPLGGKVAPQATDEVSYNTIQYSYDTRGNLLSKTYSLNGETVDTIIYNYTDTKWKDRLTSFNGTAISYDEIGNPLNWINGETLSWQRGRQLASYTNGTNTISYQYDVDGTAHPKPLTASPQRTLTSTAHCVA